MSGYQFMKRHEALRLISDAGLIFRGGGKHEKYMHPNVPELLVVLPRGNTIGVSTSKSIRKRIEQIGEILKNKQKKQEIRIVNTTESQNGNGRNYNGHPGVPLSEDIKEHRRIRVKELQALRKAAGMTQQALSKMLIELGLKKPNGGTYDPGYNIVGYWESTVCTIPEDDWNNLVALLKDHKAADDVVPPLPKYAFKGTQHGEVKVSRIEDERPLDGRTVEGKQQRARLASEDVENQTLKWGVIKHQHGRLLIEHNPDGSVTIKGQQSPEVESLRKRVGELEAEIKAWRDKFATLKGLLV